MNRRTFLGLVGAGLAGGTGAAWRVGSGHTATAGAATGASGSAILQGAPTAASDVVLALTATPGEVSMLPGSPTRVWRYTGRMVNGPAGVLEDVPASYLGPTLRLQTGQRVRVQFTNALPEPTIVHWHGLDVPDAADGHPRFMVPPGGRYQYDFTVVNRAGLYWYHPHHHHRTGPQVYQGLAGALIVSDPEERALNLPSGEHELVCVLQDRTFDRNNQLVYTSGMPMDQMSGFLGDRVVINGQIPSVKELATRAYRLRLLNGSNSRVYKLAWRDGTPMTVIGADGGLLERPAAKPCVTLAPGERADVILDLSRHEVGAQLQLQSVAFPAAPFVMRMGMSGRGGGRGMSRNGAPENGAPLTLMTFRISRREHSTFSLPERLSSYTSDWHDDPAQPPTVRRISVDFMRMQWLLAGRVFDMAAVAPDEIVRAGSKATWEFDNSGPAMMGMRLAHPLHMHGRQFRVVERLIEPAQRVARDALGEGFIDEGWKDTVLVMPGERVRVLIRFSDHRGLYLYHCHNLEHEDMGMMRNYRITD